MTWQETPYTAYILIIGGVSFAAGLYLLAFVNTRSAKIGGVITLLGAWWLLTLALEIAAAWVAVALVGLVTADPVGAGQARASSRARLSMRLRMRSRLNALRYSTKTLPTR